MALHSRALLLGLLLGLAPSMAVASDDALAFEDDLEFDDEFFEEVSKDQDARPARDASDLPDVDPVTDGPDEDPEWDMPVEPDIIDDPPEDLGGGFGDPGDDFGDDPPGDLGPTTAAPVGGFDDFDEDPPDSFDRPVPAPKPAAAPAPKAAAPAGPARLSLKVKGKDPLSGAFDASVVAIDVDAVVVELPVLVATSGTGFRGGDFTLVAEVMLGGRKVGESRHVVSAAGITDLGPTVVWVKQHVPVTDPKGEIEVRVARIDAEDPPSPLFTKTVAYRL